MANKAQDESNNDPAAWSYADVEAALPAFVLGALEADEMVAVDAFLQDNPALRTRLDEIQATVGDMLVYAPPAVEPPAAVTARIMARAQASATAPQPAPARKRLAAERTPTALPPATFRSDLARWWRVNFAPAVVGLASAGLLLLLALYFSQLQGRISLLEQELAAVQDANVALQSDNRELTEINEILRTRSLQQDAQLASLTTADSVIALRGTEAAPEAQAIFAISGDQASLAAANLPPLDADQTYQLWLIPAEGAPVSAGLLGAQPGPASTWTTTWTTTVPLRAGEFALVGLSIEPIAGSSAPTGPIVLLGEAS